MNIPQILGRENKFTGMEHYSDSTVTDIEFLQDLDVVQSCKIIIGAFPGPVLYWEKE